MKVNLLKLLAAGFYVFTAFGGLDAQETLRLQWRPSYGSLSRIACGKACHVAVGSSGTILFSSDGRQWRHIPQVTSENLRDVAFGNGMFVAVGSCGTIARSPDGMRWTVQAAQHHPCLRALAFGKGKFVAVGTDGTILISEDAVTWRLRRFSSGTFHDATFSRDQFLAVGDRGLILRSRDGEKWEITKLSTREYLRGISENGEKLIVQSSGGNRFWSVNGTDWQQVLD